MTSLTNVLKVGATRKGKTLSAAIDCVRSRGAAAVVFDPHKQSLAQAVLTHATGDVLFERLSDVRRTLGFSLLAPSTNPEPLLRELENQKRAEAFVAILLRRRDADGMAGTPLMEEWVMAAIQLYLFQAKPKPLPTLPSAFLPGSGEFEALVRDCEAPEIRYKFGQLTGLTPRALRAEVGSAARLVNGVFRSPAFTARCSGAFDLGAFLQRPGTLIVERGEDIGDDTMRVIMGAIILIVIEHARRRPRPHPPIQIYIDEATNARLVGGPELRGIAETSKNGLFWQFLVQNLDFPGGADGVLQNCLRHEWFGCPYHELARKAAVDVLAGMPRGEHSRAERLDALTHEIMTLPPGWRWVRDPAGSRKEYVPLLENPWPDWPGLRDQKLQEKLAWIYARPEYGAPGTPPSSTSSAAIPPRPSSSPGGSSVEQRWRRAGRRPRAGSPGSDAADESA